MENKEVEKDKEDKFRQKKNREIFYKESSSLRKTIMTELIEPSYFTDVKEMLEDRKSWRNTADNFSTLSKTFVGLCGVFSFASGNYQNQNFSFIAGTISVLSLVCLQFSSYAKKESKRKTDDLNKILSKLNISNMPEFNSENYKNNNKNDDIDLENQDNQQEIQDNSI
jgi:hypothetical protein